MRKDYPVYTRSEIKAIISRNPQYEEYLFARGYLITNDPHIRAEGYPFGEEWASYNLGAYRAFVHPKEKFSVVSNEGVTVGLIGHCVNPYAMQWEEIPILHDCLSSYRTGVSLFEEKIGELTGAFIIFVLDDNGIKVYTDACSMKTCSYCENSGYTYMSSHTQLIADILNLPMTTYARKLRSSRMYNVGLRWLPGITTPYASIFRLGPNYTLFHGGDTLQAKRFFPSKKHYELENGEYDAAAEKIALILEKTLRLYLKKWPRCAMSLTGGMDSKTTFSCAKDCLDAMKIFSFCCKESEKADSKVASRICERVKTPHLEYQIPDENSAVPGFDDLKIIIDHNTAYTMNLSDPEIRKIIYFIAIDDYDVEIKSDVAEIGRVFYERKYGMKMPAIPNARECSVIQTRFFMMPRLLQETDKQYESYLRFAGLSGVQQYNYENLDLLYWELRIGASAAMTTLSLSLSTYITFPYNNRNLIEIFLAYPHELRACDWPQRRIIAERLPWLLEPEYEVNDRYFGKRRKLMEKAFFIYKTALYNTIHRKWSR